MKKESPSGKFIIVKRNARLYKVFIKDLKIIKVRPRKALPPVPSFFKKESIKDTETEVGSTVSEDVMEEENQSLMEICN